MQYLWQILKLFHLEYLLLNFGYICTNLHRITTKEKNSSRKTKRRRRRRRRKRKRKEKEKKKEKTFVIMEGGFSE